MNLISTKAHGILDYLYGTVLFASPWMFHFNNGRVEMVIPIIIGTMLTITSLFTRYELGLVPVIPMRIHLIIDILAGIFLSTSPWIFNFDETVYMPHVVFGLISVIVPLLTRVRQNNARFDNNPNRVIP